MYVWYSTLLFNSIISSACLLKFERGLTIFSLGSRVLHGVGTHKNTITWFEKKTTEHRFNMNEKLVQQHRHSYWKANKSDSGVFRQFRLHLFIYLNFTLNCKNESIKMVKNLPDNNAIFRWLPSRSNPQDSIECSFI